MPTSEKHAFLYSDDGMIAIPAMNVFDYSLVFISRLTFGKLPLFTEKKLTPQKECFLAA